MDTVRECMTSFTSVNKPPRYVIHIPDLFNAWCDWATIVEQRMIMRPKKTAEIMPMGENIKPDWLEYSFETLEGFYQYLNEIIQLRFDKDTDDTDDTDGGEE